MKFRIRMFQQYRGLIEELVTRDLKLKYRRSFLGYVWSVLNPLLVMTVMTVVFSAMFKQNIENYPVYLLTGRMTFEFFTASTNAAMNSVTGNAALMKKTYIPKYIFTVSKVTSSLVDYVFSLSGMTDLRSLPRDTVRSVLASHMKDGVLTVPKEYGMFVCRSPKA